MTTFLVVFAVMMLAVSAMAVGVMVSGREIKGSCGGLNTEGDCPCQGSCESGERGASR
ncbi:hypothetical protein [Spectribacter hydrogenoxidans]|uniref:(Na+)-NQR maturation NqrM n=1 Tax=Spectribacter hydrogenoxidans TaxID=3075608 RepID=A0ABU3BXI4_9GAMM|nr:hypothetical protein [Salinisphaera sp. W335]MDT0633970.1 hypothetical protein [Salinisphaera sp. W335]